MKSKFNYPYDVAAAIRHLTESDSAFAAHIDTIGRYRLPLRPSYTSFQALLRAVVYQQVSKAAAATVFSRICSLTPSGRLPGALGLSKIDDASLQACGLSGQKLSYIRALVDASLEKRVPSLRRLSAMTDAQVEAELTQIKGIGLWTVQMLLIFHLGRPDVLPVGDLAIRKGFGLVYPDFVREERFTRHAHSKTQVHNADRRKKQAKQSPATLPSIPPRLTPTPRELKDAGERWRPYRTVASWYLWRAANPNS